MFAQDIVPLDSGPLAGAWLVPDTQTSRASVYLVVFSGESDNSGPEGLMHYVMHLAWFNAMGDKAPNVERQSSASMNPTDIGYFIEGPATDLKDLVAMIGGILEPIALEDEFMLDQRDALLRERALRLAEDAYAPIKHKLDHHMYGDAPRSRADIGVPADIASFSLQEARALHTATHRPGNAALIVYGDVTAEAANDAIARVFGTGDGPGALPQPSVETPEPGRYFRVIANSDLPQPAVFYRKVIALDTARDIVALDRTSDILARLLALALPADLAGPPGHGAVTAFGYDLDIAVLDDRHLELSFSAKLASGVSPKAVLSIFEETLQKTALSGVDESRFAHARERVADLLRRDPNPARAVLAVALDSLVLGVLPSDFDSYIQATEHVDLEQIDTLAAELAKPGRTVITLVEP